MTSPALIEKTRSTVTDAEGRYRLTHLPVGTYEVTFFLQGFTTVKRTGVVVTSEFTARVDAEMKVSGTVQAVTVIAEVPVVGACGIAPPGHWRVQPPAGGLVSDSGDDSAGATKAGGKRDHTALRPGSGRPERQSEGGGTETTEARSESRCLD